MLVACWSVKGGVGTTVVAASLALLLARRVGPGVVLADLAGDGPAVLGLPEPDSPGLAGWLAGGGVLFTVGLVAFAAHLAWQIVRLDIDDPLNCLAVFKSNRDAGLILFAALVLDAAWRAL